MNERAASLGIKDFFRFPQRRELTDGISLTESVVSSAQGIRTARSIATLGMLIAAQLALRMVAEIPIGSHIRISFGFLAQAVTGMLFGPVPAALCAAISDILKVFIKAEAYFPGFTITAALSGFVYGIAFYKRRVGIYHILFAKLVINLIVNLLINSVNLYILYRELTGAMLLSRAIKNLVMLPIDVAMISIVLPSVRSAYRAVFRS